MPTLGRVFWILLTEEEDDKCRWKCPLRDEGDTILFGPTKRAVLDVLIEVGLVPQRCRMKKVAPGKYKVKRPRRRPHAVTTNTQPR